MCTPASAPQVGHPRQQRQSFYCQDFDVSNWDYQSDFPPLEPEKTIKETIKGGGLVTKGKGKGKPPREDPTWNATEVTPNKNKTSGQPHGQRCAKSCDLNEWQANAKLTTIQQIKRALENGECQPGNLVLTRDTEVLTELQNIWAAHDLGSHALTVGVLAAPDVYRSCLLSLVGFHHSTIILQFPTLPISCSKIPMLPLTRFANLLKVLKFQQLPHKRKARQGRTVGVDRRFLLCRPNFGTSFAERWLQAGELPEALLQARTIFLPKDSKTKDGCIEPMHCRPITILSVFWRVWVSAWLKKRTTTEWIKTVLHTEVPYGNQMDAANAAGNILEAYGKDKDVGSLDYTKCFDLLRPQACARMMTQAGFHPQMNTLCELLWTQHKRWCSWEGFYSPILQSSLSLAIPQGDPFGPLVAALYLSAGQRCVESNIPHNHASSSIFMDDRTFTARSAADLHERVSQWHQWSTSVGLIESTEKTQVTAKGPA